MVSWYINTIFASCGILTYGVCLHYLAKNFDCKKIQNYILCLESVISLLIYIGYLVLSLANHFLVADSIICGSITFLLYVKEDISLILNTIRSYIKFKTTKRVINLQVWWSDSKCVKFTTKIVLATILIEFILNFINMFLDWEMWPEYTLCMNKERPENLHDTVNWEFWDAIVVFYVVSIICVIIWDFTSFRLVKKWLDTQDRYLLHNLSTDELHLKNEPQMKSTIINALVLFFYGIYAAIPFDALTFDDVFLIYQTGTIIFLPLILVWNHDVTKRIDSEHERESRRRLVYDEARARRAEIKAKQIRRTQEQTFQMECSERYQAQALKGQFGMYGGDDSNLQDDRLSLEFYDNGFQNMLEFKSPDHFLWI